MRTSTIAGSWYPGNKGSLTALIDELLEKAEVPPVAGRPFGVISPHAGIQFSGAAAACAYKPLRGSGLRRVVLMGPSHYTCLRGIAVSGSDYYETPLGKIRVDRAACQSLAAHVLFQGPSRAEMPEHSLEMQLPFLQAVLGEFDLVPLVVGELAEGEFAAAAAELNRHLTADTVVVASSDFTHYGRRFGYVPFRENVKENLKKLDGDAIQAILARDAKGFLSYVEHTGATICGCRPIGVLLNMVPAAAQARQLAYYTSGDVIGDYADTVSYAAILFSVP